jgi:hypothetical protein
LANLRVEVPDDLRAFLKDCVRTIDAAEKDTLIAGNDAFQSANCNGGRVGIDRFVFTYTRSVAEFWELRFSEAELRAVADGTVTNVDISPRSTGPAPARVKHGRALLCVGLGASNCAELMDSGDLERWLLTARESVRTAGNHIVDLWSPWNELMCIGLTDSDCLLACAHLPSTYATSLGPDGASEGVTFTDLNGTTVATTWSHCVPFDLAVLAAVTFMMSGRLDKRVEWEKRGLGFAVLRAKPLRAGK